MRYSWWCLQNRGEGTGIQHYKLSLVPASRGHCCSINFSKRLSFGIPCGSLAWWFIEFWRMLRLQKSLFLLKSENFWDFRKQITSELSPRSWRQSAFCHASFQPVKHCWQKCCRLAPVLQRLCVGEAISRRNSNLGKHYASVISETLTCPWGISGRHGRSWN